MKESLNQKVLEALEWYQSIGIDETVHESPFDKTVNPHDIIRQMVGDVPEKTQNLIADKKELKKQAEPLGRATAVQDAQKIVSACQTITDLKTALEGFEACPLKETATSFIFADGNPQSGIMFIGDAPDAEEDREGTPFVGPQGDFFRMMISHIGLADKNNYYLSSVLPWRPPGGRAPTETELVMIKPFTLKHIEIVKPKVLVLVGAVAAKAILGEKKGILKLRQGWHELPLPSGEKIQTKAMFSASFLLEQPAQKRAAWNDLLEIKQRLFS